MEEVENAKLTGHEEGYELSGLRKINVVLGKNGCGKSRMLRDLEEKLFRDTKGEQAKKKVKYITPERGGLLIYQPSVEHGMQDTATMANDRRHNQQMNFRTQSVALYKKLELVTLREIAGPRRGDLDYTFETAVVRKINRLLDNIEIKPRDAYFIIHRKGTENELQAGMISSGETELISLAIECLLFEKDCDPAEENWLMMDEPDLHLHPDLQQRFARFLIGLVENDRFKVVIATHSTALLGALSDHPDGAVAFMKQGDKDLKFEQISDVHRKILPVFGAHPLSQVFNQRPVLLVEGEDDERIWQQAVRTSLGKISVFPCAVGSKGEFQYYEPEVKRILNAVYDNARAYSLRDRDSSPEDILDEPPLIRMRLTCKGAENLLLTDEVLTSLSTTWRDVESRIDSWIERNNDHQYWPTMNAFKEGGYDRKTFDLKEIRNLLMGAVIGSNKPWEVAVGQVIAGLKRTSPGSGEHSIINYLGMKLVNAILPD